MELGVSTSCLYPLETEKALRTIGELGIKHTEIFFNSPSELEKEYLKKLCGIKNYYGLDIATFHPYMSFAEGFYIFSCYKRRFYDSLEMYRPMFNAAAEIGAKYFVMHGSKLPMEIEKEEYAERFYLFDKTAKEYGISVAHENVVYYASQSPDFMRYLKDTLGDNFKAVLDIKQARRANENPYDFIDVLGDSIVHLHLSDYSKDEDCQLPSENGLFDFRSYLDTFKKRGYEGKALIEVYRRNYGEYSELKEGLEYLEKVLESVKS